MKTPSISSFRWDLSGWTIETNSPSRRIWHNSNGDLLVQNFGPSTSTGLPQKWRDVEVLRQHLLKQSPDQIAVVSIDVVLLAGGDVSAAQYVHKERRAETTHGMTYVGTFAIPFADVFTTLLFIAPEYGTTGVREAVLVAAGKVEMPIPDGPIPHLSNEQLEIELRNWKPRLSPCDDEQWDSLFPDHPLSRVRQYLRSARESMQVDPQVTHRPPYGDRTGWIPATKAGVFARLFSRRWK